MKTVVTLTLETFGDEETAKAGMNDARKLALELLVTAHKTVEHSKTNQAVLLYNDDETKNGKFTAKVHVTDEKPPPPPPAPPATPPAAAAAGK